jgi:hypothetical protein
MLMVVAVKVGRPSLSLWCARQACSPCVQPTTCRTCSALLDTRYSQLEGALSLAVAQEAQRDSHMMAAGPSLAIGKHLLLGWGC